MQITVALRRLLLRIVMDRCNSTVELVVLAAPCDAAYLSDRPAHTAVQVHRGPTDRDDATIEGTDEWKSPDIH